MDEIEAGGFLFDMDGTLVDSTAVVEHVWTEFCRTHGLDPVALLAYAHGRQAADTIAHFLPALSDAERAGLVAGLVAEELTRTDGIVEIPGAAELLARLQKQGAPVAVVTSAPRDLAVTRMRAAGVPIPGVLVAAEHVERGKPDPQGYQLAAERLGVPIAECVVFEDAEAGLTAAVASGARVVVVGAHESGTTEGLPRLRDYRGSGRPSSRKWCIAPTPIRRGSSAPWAPRVRRDASRGARLQAWRSAGPRSTASTSSTASR